MPALSKKSLSLYLRNGCARQFVLSLYNDAERARLHLPPRQQGRAGLGLVGEAGYDWQDAKVGELKGVFGADSVREAAARRGRRPQPIPLRPALTEMGAHQFVVEADYVADTPTFRSAVGLTDLRDCFGNPVSLSELHPDIVQALPPLRLNPGPALAGEVNPYALGVRPDGETAALAADDPRLRLRVIDVKLTAEPGPHYFAEVAYYSMALAAWLLEERLEDRLVVVAAPAVWPGSHEASSLARRASQWRLEAHTPSPAELAAALEEDLEIAPLDVYASRLRRLLAEELPALLRARWQELPWHVDYRCKGCEFLGGPWLDEQRRPTSDAAHCLPTAERVGHLSRVTGLSRGASGQLRRRDVPDVATLAATRPADLAFEAHQTLRVGRAALPHRAASLLSGEASVIPESGGDALMPRWPDLHLYAFLDYDLGSAITAALSLRAFWREPLPYGSSNVPATRWWTRKNDEADVFPVDLRTVEREREEFLKFLRQLRKVLREVGDQDEADAAAGRRDKRTATSTYQIYLWDEAQRKHLTRLVGRHLAHILADPSLRNLAWLFPPPELLQHAEDATRQSPVTLVASVVEKTIAVPVAHHYRLLDVVASYHPESSRPPGFHPLYQEPLSDLVPGERLHEWWARVGNWKGREDLIVETNRKKAYALNLVATRLERDLGPVLSRQAAPPIARPPRGLTGVAPQSRLWYEYARLNAALDGLEAHTTRAMPPHEREARQKSARLTRRLAGAEAAAALDQLVERLALSPGLRSDLLVYELAPGSRDVNLRPGDFNYALSPERRHGFLDESVGAVTRGTPLERRARAQSIADAGLTQVTVEAIDRDRGLIALRPGQRARIADLERWADLDFSRDVVLDPLHRDFLAGKLELTLAGLGYPAVAEDDQRALEAMGLPGDAQPESAPPTPAAELLWCAPRLAGEAIPGDLGPVRTILCDHLARTGAQLDESQWAAWEHALGRRLALVWGPPGTGKSRTLRAVVLGAVLTARAARRPLRLLVTAHTYTAIDNVLVPLRSDLQGLLPAEPYTLVRLQSEWREAPADPEAGLSGIQSLALSASRPSAEVAALRERLEYPEGTLIVAGPPQQLHNLAVAGISRGSQRGRHTIRGWFDRIVLDEASQLDVASSALVFTKLAAGGACVLAGDDLQLPPIQKAEPPKGLEPVVGSAYDYFRRHHGVIPAALDVNYRSNQTLVDFTRLAGYSPALHSHSPDLRLALLSPLPAERPGDWPPSLAWSPDWAALLDPDYPAVSFVYDDDLSSQVNDFEADAVAALLWLLRWRLADRPLNERDNSGAVLPEPARGYSAAGFWERAVGVVTPHRAQMARVVTRLQGLFAADPPEAIRGAVDTVERFQGQQRDVVVASFGVGDPDIIRAEDEFLYSLNRFNVLTSRARAKLVVFVTRSLLEHLSDDTAVLAESRLLKRFVESYCVAPRPAQLGVVRQQAVEARPGTLRRR